MFATAIGCGNDAAEKTLKLELLREKERAIVREIDDWKSKRDQLVANRKLADGLQQSIGESTSQQDRASHQQTLDGLDELIRIQESSLADIRSEIAAMANP